MFDDDDDNDNDDDDWSSGKEVIRDAYIAMKQQVVGRSSIHLVEEIVPPWHATSLSCFSVEVYLRPFEKSTTTRGLNVD